MWCKIWACPMWPLLCWGMFLLYPLCWEFISWNNVTLCQMLFLHVLKLLYIFILPSVNAIYHIYVYDEQSLYFRNEWHNIKSWSWIWFVIIFFWGHLHLCSLGILVSNFLFFLKLNYNWHMILASDIKQWFNIFIHYEMITSVVICVTIQNYNIFDYIPYAKLYVPVTYFLYTGNLYLLTLFTSFTHAHPPAIMFVLWICESVWFVLFVFCSDSTCRIKSHGICLSLPDLFHWA